MYGCYSALYGDGMRIKLSIDGVGCNSSLKNSQTLEIHFLQNDHTVEQKENILELASEDDNIFFSNNYNSRRLIECYSRREKNSNSISFE